MPHAPPWRGGTAGDEPRHRFLHLRAHQKLGSLFFCCAADLTNQDNTLGLRVGKEQLEDLNKLGPLDRIAPNADAGRLPETEPGRLRHSFIGQGA